MRRNYALVIKHGLLENPPFIVHVKISIYRGFSISMFHSGTLCWIWVPTIFYPAILSLSKGASAPLGYRQEPEEAEKEARRAEQLYREAGGESGAAASPWAVWPKQSNAIPWNFGWLELGIPSSCIDCIVMYDDNRQHITDNHLQ